MFKTKTNISRFHPSQITNALLAKIIWDKLEKEVFLILLFICFNYFEHLQLDFTDSLLLFAQHPDFIGPVNPHNAEIEAMFGNQGGY